MTTDKCLTDRDLTLYCTEDLPADQMRTAAEHISSCSACARSLTATRQALAALPSENLKLSDAEQRQFSDRVLQAAKAGRTGGRLQAWGAALTAVAAGLLAVVLFQPADTQINTIHQQNQQYAELNLVEDLEMLEMMELLEVMDLLELLDEKG